MLKLHKRSILFTIAGVLAIGCMAAALCIFLPNPTAVQDGGTSKPIIKSSALIEPGPLAEFRDGAQMIVRGRVIERGQAFKNESNFTVYTPVTLAVQTIYKGDTVPAMVTYYEIGGEMSDAIYDEGTPTTKLGDDVFVFIPEQKYVWDGGNLILENNTVTLTGFYQECADYRADTRGPLPQFPVDTFAQMVQDALDPAL